MQIKEVSNQTGLTIKTIRFYEERGLISPQTERRNGKNFRCYQESDVQQLQMVATLRKCLFSIEQIKTMLEHPELTPDIFTEYRHALLEQRDLLCLLAEKAETVQPEQLKDPETLARRLTMTARPLPLPTMDVKPNFGRFDPETPQERQAAFLQWQKTYRWRYVRRWAPLCILVLALVSVTVIYGAWLTSRCETLFFDLPNQIPKQLDFLTVQLPQKSSLGKDVTYALYQTDGTLCQDPSVTDAMEPLSYLFPLTEDNAGQLAQWVSVHGLGQSYVHSSMLRQTAFTTMPVQIGTQTYTMALYLRHTPLLLAMRKLMLLYLSAGFAVFCVLAFRTTSGYGFRLRFLRNYDITSGPRNHWNDAILSIDEHNGNATLLTQQYTGMNTLVSMDYKTDRK